MFEVQTLEDFLGLAWILCFITSSSVFIYYTIKVNKFRKDVKSKFNDLYVETTPESTILSSTDNMVFFIYIHKRKYRLTNDRFHIELGDRVLKLGFVYMCTFCALAFVTLYIILM